MTDWLTRKEAQEYLRISQPSLWRLVAAGRLKSYSIEGLVGKRYRREDLDALLRENELKPQ